MQGRKDHQEKLFIQFQFSEYIPADNFCRRLKKLLNLDFLYGSTEELPWHSTLSRIRKLYGEDIFLDLFKQLLKRRINQGLINGTRQAVDSALIPANAAKQSMVERRYKFNGDFIEGLTYLERLTR